MRKISKATRHLIGPMIMVTASALRFCGKKERKLRLRQENVPILHGCMKHVDILHAFIAGTMQWKRPWGGKERPTMRCNRYFKP